MIEVELPDGTIAEFPEGTPHEVIQGALQKRFAPTAQAQPAAAPMPADDGRNSILGKVDTAVRGAADTLSLGFADEISAGLNTGFGYLGDYSKELANQRGIDKADESNRFGYRLGGQIAGGVGGGVGMARSGVSLGANAINAGMKLPAVAAASGVEGALLGGAHGLGSGEGIDDRLSQGLSGAEWGLGLGAAAPLAVSGVSSAARRAISPFTSSPERQAAVDVLTREGVPLTAGQKTGSDWLRYRESELGGPRAAQMLDDQGRAFTDAAMRRAGGSGLADGPNLSAMRDRLGTTFKDLSSRNQLRFDQGFADDIVNMAQDYSSVLGPHQKEGLFETVGALAPHLQQGSLPGDVYQATRSRLSRQANSLRQSDPEYSNALRSVRNALDDAMGRSVSSADREAWQTARRQYGNMKTIEKAIASAGGENAALGVISPARLRMAASSGNRGGYARGEGDFAELAKAGQAAMTPLPNSGTASRMSARNMGTGLLSLLGAGAGAQRAAQLLLSPA
jgi:hypothetical protein